MADRWQLARAGITNVYQYGDELLRFAGGRLLLRGVNGSGKSTAMNMLLPFLLDADTRRIDAAGEQSGVLRAWMLSGRDEQQPVGYLWIELERGEDHLVFGCGIRANRSTDRVTTWWFVTDRRPHIDLSLVRSRTPLSAEALREELGPSAVFTHEQRAAYRAELRNRLYGGADIDQHLRLLHIVRNPRVGDRIDVELPTYLEDALPQLSEAALDDAAQPLEDLEEHRRNVETLTRTAGALDALLAVYRDYARAELRQRADHARSLVAAHRAAARAVSEAAAQRAEAEARRSAARSAIDQGEANERRLRDEIRALESRDAYKAGAELTDVRNHVESERAHVVALERDVSDRHRRLDEAHEDLHAARHNADGDARFVRDRLADLERLAIAAGLGARPPSTPSVDILVDAASGVELPADPLDAGPARRAIGDLRAAITTRHGDLQRVRAGARVAAQAFDAVQARERDVQYRDDLHRTAIASLGTARAERDDAASNWRDALRGWSARLDDHRRNHGLVAPDGTTEANLDAPGLADRRDEIAVAFTAAAQRVVDHHAGAVATLEARSREQDSAVQVARQELDELLARTLPDPPLATWQHPRDGRCFAELVDFHDGVGDAPRAAVEAALEAAGILAAEVDGDGLRLADGRLLARAGKPADASLASILRPIDEISELGEPPLASTVSRLIETISIDADHLAADDERTVITTDGRFRVGVLRGKHAKTASEHIGVTARRALLERQRADAQRRLDTAQDALESTGRHLDGARSAHRAAVALRDDVPAPSELVEALARLDVAERRLEQADEELDAARRSLEHAETAYASAIDELRRVAFTAGLPHDSEALDAVEQNLRESTAGCNLLDKELTAYERAVQTWQRRASAWLALRSDRDDAEERLRRARQDYEHIATRLATLEDSVGVEYDEIVRAIQQSTTDLEIVGDRVKRSRADEQAALLDAEGRRGDEQHASEVRDAAAGSCLDALARLRGVLTVPGLVGSAFAGTESPLSGAVDESPTGLADLAASILRVTPDAERSGVSAESVRQSLRQRRDTIGAGWDAEDHQPDPTLPLHIQVTGPLITAALPDAGEAVANELRSMGGLLSAKQDQALRNLLQGLLAKEVAEKLLEARELVSGMNHRLASVRTAHGIGASLRWVRRDDLDDALVTTLQLLAKQPELRTEEEDLVLAAAVSERIAEARLLDSDAPYRDLIARVLDYRAWHRMGIVVHRPGRDDERLTRRTALSEGEKKMVSYLALFAAVAASCDALREHSTDAPRFLLLDDAFAKVSEDNHPKLFGLLVDLELDFIATSERLWGTHTTVPELAITEVVRDADLGVIVLEHARWDGHVLQRE